jgi:hypothetical protein
VLGIASVAFYRACIHPLRKYPGPKLAAISRLPYLWNAYNGDLVWWVDQLHRKYGPIVRIAPYELSFTNAKLGTISTVTPLVARRCFKRI